MHWLGTRGCTAYKFAVVCKSTCLPPHPPPTPPWEFYIWRLALVLQFHVTEPNSGSVKQLQAMCICWNDHWHLQCCAKTSTYCKFEWWVWDSTQNWGVYRAIRASKKHYTTKHLFLLLMILAMGSREDLLHILVVAIQALKVRYILYETVFIIFHILHLYIYYVIYLFMILYVLCMYLYMCACIVCVCVCVCVCICKHLQPWTHIRKITA